MNTQNVRQEDWILGGLALLLAIDLLFLPWFEASATFGGISVSASSTATGAPDGWLGVLGMIAAIALLADLAVEQLSPQTELPSIGGSRAMTRLALAGAAGLFVVLKFLFHIHFSYFGFGFWAGIVLTGGLLFMAFRATQQVTAAS